MFSNANAIFMNNATVSVSDAYTDMYFESLTQRADYPETFDNSIARIASMLRVDKVANFNGVDVDSFKLGDVVNGVVIVSANEFMVRFQDLLPEIDELPVSDFVLLHTLAESIVADIDVKFFAN